MSRMLNLAVAAAVLGVAGCASTPPPSSPMDAAVVQSYFGAAVHTRYASEPVTARNWNCSCMCSNPKGMKSNCYH